MGSLADPLLPRLSQNIDLLLFNPPYVPTYNEEMLDAQSSADIQGAWAGGKDGMHVTDTLLDQLTVRSFMLYTTHIVTYNHHQDLLSPVGRFYLVAVKDNNVPGIRTRMAKKYGIRSEVSDVASTTQ